MKCNTPEFWLICIAWALIIGGLGIALHLAGMMIGIGVMMLMAFGEFQIVRKDGAE